MFQVLSTSKKRKVDSPIDFDGMKENMPGLQAQCQSRLADSQVLPRNFLRLPGNGAVLESEEWKEQSTTLYRPLRQDVMVNLRQVEQLSFASGTFFVADDRGVYKDTQEGYVINLWRFSEAERKMFIARSLLVTDFQVFDHVRQQLDKM